MRKLWKKCFNELFGDASDQQKNETEMNIRNISSKNLMKKTQ